MQPPIYRFQYKNRLGQWVPARYRASIEVIRASHDEFQILEEPEGGESNVGVFTALRKEDRRDRS